MTGSELALTVLGGLLAGQALNLLVLWLPRRILDEDARWVAEVSGQALPDKTPWPQLVRPWHWNGWRWWLLPAAAAGLAVALQRLHGTSLTVVLQILLGWVLLALAAIDMRHQLLPDALTQPFLWLGLLVQLHPATRTIGVEAALLGAVLGYLMLWLLSVFYKVLRKQEGLGQGDMKFLAMAGAWLGPSPLPWLLFVAALLGLLWQSVAMWRGRADRHSYFAFGPWLVLAALWVLLWPAR